MSADVPHAAPRRQLSLFDSVCLIVGVIIGSGLYETTPTIGSLVGGVPAIFGVWLIGGCFALAGALCYAELATTYPAEGGDFVYLSRAFGRRTGFLFAWIQLWIVRPGSIGAMAFVFARYATQLFPLGPYSAALYAAGAVVGLAGINILGVRVGKWTQNVLTVAKLVGLAVVFVVGMSTTPEPSAAVEPVVSASGTNFSLALIFVLFAYGGWNEMAYVAAEVQRPERNILRALMLGTVAVMTVYVLANVAFLHALGYDGMIASHAVAADVMRPRLGAWGARSVSLLVAVSALGAMNGMIFTGSRIYYAMGRRHRWFAPLGRWSPRFGSPINSITIEAAITTAMIALLAGSYEPGEDFFGHMLILTTPPFWFFLGLSAISLIVLRRREPNQPRTFRVPGYPLLPLTFAIGCWALVYESVRYAWSQQPLESVWPLAMLAIGAMLCLVERGES